MGTTVGLSAREPNFLQPEVLLNNANSRLLRDRKHTDTLCGQSILHWKHIKSPLQSPAG
jgi:hypothetical protein